MNGSAYSTRHGGHDWAHEESRGHRKQSKVIRAMKGVASFDLLDEVAREDRKRARQSNTHGPSNQQTIQQREQHEARQQ